MINKNNKRIAITLSKKTYENLKKYCKETNQTISQIIERQFKND